MAGTRSFAVASRRAFVLLRLIFDVELFPVEILAAISPLEAWVPLSYHNRRDLSPRLDASNTSARRDLDHSSPLAELSVDSRGVSLSSSSPTPDRPPCCFDNVYPGARSPGPHRHIESQPMSLPFHGFLPRPANARPQRSAAARPATIAARRTARSQSFGSSAQLKQKDEGFFSGTSVGLLPEEEAKTKNGEKQRREPEETEVSEAKSSSSETPSGTGASQGSAEPPDGRGSSASGSPPGSGSDGSGDGGRRGRRSGGERALQKPIVPDVYPQVMAIPIAKRPLFPGFYKAITIKDPNVASAITEMIKRGQHTSARFCSRTRMRTKM